MTIRLIFDQEARALPVIRQALEVRSGAERVRRKGWSKASSSSSRSATAVQAKTLIRPAPLHIEK